MTNVKIFYDYAWPFCYLATGLVAKLKEDNVSCNIEWVPSELNPDTPLEGVNMEDNYSKQEIKDIYDNLGEIGEPYNIVFGSSSMSFNTHRALLAGEYAKTVDKYDDFSKSIFTAVNITTKNVGDKKILNNIAKSVGLDIEEMNRLIDEGYFEKNLIEAKELASKHDIKEVPTFVINDQQSITNVREYNKLKEAILEAD